MGCTENSIAYADLSSIDVFCSDKPLCDDIKSQIINVSYPDYWLAPVQLSPFAISIEDETIACMDSLGLVPNAQCLEHLRAMEPRHYAGYSHSMASYEHALMYCKYITMWLLWDDHCVEVASDFASIAAPLQALAGETVTTHATDPYVAAFQHIGDEYERLGASRNWRIRFADKMKEWAQCAIDEETIRRTITTGAHSRSFEQAVKLRAITVGIRPNSIPLERAVGIELPSSIYFCSDYAALIDKAALICCIINDIVGVPKDIKNNQINSNLVLYHRLCFQTSLFDSYQAVLTLHNQAITEYDDLAKKLLHNCEPPFRERLSTFIAHLRYMDTGFGLWHRDCIRYQHLVAVENQRVFRIAITDHQESENHASNNMHLVQTP